MLCTASVQAGAPFLRNTGRGWVTAEYGMLPRSTPPRQRGGARRRRAAAQEDPAADRANLRAVTDLATLGERQIRIDCDVLQARMGDSHRVITGAMSRCIRHWGKVAAGLRCRSATASRRCRAASSRNPVLDLDYAEIDGPDRRHFVLTGGGGIVEIRRRPRAPFDEASFTPDVGARPCGIAELMRQRGRAGLV
jgi:ribonuclease PH